MRIKAIHTTTALYLVFITLLCAYGTNVGAYYNHDAMSGMQKMRQDSTSQLASSMPDEYAPARKHGGLIFKRASKEPPQALFKDAVLEESLRNYAAAGKKCDLLVRSHPFAPEAPEAQLLLGQVLEKRGKYTKAFDEYLYLLYFYPESAPVDSVLKKMYAIANYCQSEGKTARAINRFTQIALIAPKWRHTPKALMQIGNMRFKNKDYFEAAEAFDKVAANYPESPEATTAAENHALVLYALSRKYPEDDTLNTRAITLTTIALGNGNGKTPNNDKLRDCLRELNERRRARHFKMAEFYDCSRFTTETKIAAYQDFVRKFPTSELTDQAKCRIEHLEKLRK